jgi:hypothetical protein
MDKEDVVHAYNGISFSYKEELNYIICRKMDGNGYHHVEQDKTSSER